jgi:hypothetical protein
MNDHEKTALEWDQALERLAADATDTAYAIALRHGAGGSWVDLQLGLWEALAGTVREWGRRPIGVKSGRPGGHGNDRPQAGAVVQQERSRR